MTTLEDGGLTVDDLIAWMVRFDERIVEQAELLTELDSAIGDADHGTNMARGTAAVRRGSSRVDPTTRGRC